MNKENLVEFLKLKQGYLKSGAPKISKLFNVNEKIALESIQQATKELEYPITPFKRLFFDIETSPNTGWFWRSGWKLNIQPNQILEERKVISVSWKWEGEKYVYNLNWDKNKCDKELLQKFSKVLEKADEVIGHNSDRFDIPWLRTRCLFHRIPFTTYIKSVDTLKKVKASFNFQSNKLDYIAEFLGFGNKKPTGIKLWLDLTFGNVESTEYEKSMIIMNEYCDYDVVLLEDVYRTIQSYIKPSTHLGISLKSGRYSCPNCAKTNITYINHTVTQTGIIKRHMKCDNCLTDYIIPNKVFLKEFEE